MNDTVCELTAKLPESLSKEFSSLPENILADLEEIRLIAGQPVRIRTGTGEKTLKHVIDGKELQRSVNSLIKFSYYAYEDDIAKGFVTVEGGHRIGICGRSVLKKSCPALIKEISSLNIRIAREYPGCSDSFFDRLIERGIPLNTLIVSPPGCGKTTMLRDLARNFSCKGYKTAICDERSEIAGMYNCLPSFNLGPRTDVLDGCPKAFGIIILIRSMSPQVIVCDEIGTVEDIEAFKQCTNAGVAVISSVHGNSVEELMKSPAAPLLEKQLIKRLVFLDDGKSPGHIREVCNV